VKGVVLSAGGTVGGTDDKKRITVAFDYTLTRSGRGHPQEGPVLD